MEATLTSPDFSNPAETLKILTSENISYDELTDFCEKLADKITVVHTNQDDRKFQAITPVYLGVLQADL